MKIIIREANTDDLKEIIEIYRDAGLDTLGNINPEDACNIYKKMKSYPNYKLYVAEDNGKIYGTFALLIMDNLANGGMPSGIVEDVAVITGAQGKGIGKAMMKYALEECRRIGCYKVMLSSNEKRIDAHKFYESIGFVRHGYSYKSNI